MARIPVQTKPFLSGAAAGPVALTIVGFAWGGWVTGRTAEQLAIARADQAVISSLTPICVAQFRKDPRARANLAAMNAIDRWQRTEYVSKGGWATMPDGSGEPNREVASACADALIGSAA